MRSENRYQASGNSKPPFCEQARALRGLLLQPSTSCSGLSGGAHSILRTSVYEERGFLRGASPLGEGVADKQAEGGMAKLVWTFRPERSLGARGRLPPPCGFYNFKRIYDIIAGIVDIDRGRMTDKNLEPMPELESLISHRGGDDEKKSAGGAGGLYTHIVVLTEKERGFVNKILDQYKRESPDICSSINSRLNDITHLAEIIAHFPSLLERQVSYKETRDKLTLIESLLTKRAGDKMLHLPSKATLGKGFLVAKFHLFTLFSNLAATTNMAEHDVAELKAITSALLFTLMAEDVYLNLLDATELPLEIRRQVAMALIILWEHRTDFIVKDIAPVLQAVWDSRQKLAPVFGSMMGTSELLVISMDQDNRWNAFLSAMLKDNDITQALEEFLFGLSFEQIQSLKNLLAQKGVHTIDREKISDFLHEDIKLDLNSDPRDFYMLYTVRRDNARVRKRLGLQGPHNTLEDYYMRFVLEQYKEAQFNDIFP